MEGQVGTESETEAAHLSLLLRGQKQATTLVNDLIIEEQIKSFSVNDVITEWGPHFPINLLKAVRFSPSRAI